MRFETSPVALIVQNAVARVTLNRPDSLNALDLPMAQALAQALSAVAEDASVRAVILDGAGRAFMAGGDIRLFHDDPGGAPRTADGLIGLFHRTIRTMRSIPVPVIAAVHGAVAGGGLGLALAADLVIAADDAKFVPAYAAIGTSPDGGTTWSLARLADTRRAMALLMLGDPIDAASALSYGLVSQVVRLAELEATAVKMATRLAAGATRALASVKQLVHKAMDTPLDAHLDDEQRHFVAAAGTADFREGVAAFFERRPPRFTGR
jgi:2-(1,2-epoxy-1,2-dihydrophenyl)acetyl-CoA isomerase